MFRTLSSLALTVVLAAGLTVTAEAKDASVRYEGGAEKFVFLPGSDDSETDLFDNFKGVMPGAVLSQTITVKNNYKGCDKVKIYLRAEAHREDESVLSEEAGAAIADAADMQDFLNQLSMTVRNGDKVISEATAAEPGGLRENVELGTFRYGEETKLTVELSIPEELDNTYANRIGEVDWVFSVEERNDLGGKPHHSGGKSDRSGSVSVSVQTVVDSAKTGDSTNVLPWLAALALSVTGLVICIRRRRREKG